MNDKFCVICPRNTTTAAAGATSLEECVPNVKPPGPKKGTDGNDAYCHGIPMGAHANIAQCRKHYQNAASTCTDCTVCASGEYPKTACTNTTNTVCEAIPTGHTIAISFGVTLSAYTTVAAFDAGKPAYHRGVLKAAQLPADTAISSTAALATSSRRLLAGVAVTTTIETAAANVGAANLITTNSLTDALATEGIAGSISITTPPAVATVAPTPAPTTAAPTPAPTTTTAAPALSSGAPTTRGSLLAVLLAAVVGFLLRQ
jgi:hypothetical protein